MTKSIMAAASNEMIQDAIMSDPEALLEVATGEMDPEALAA